MFSKHIMKKRDVIASASLRDDFFEFVKVIVMTNTNALAIKVPTTAIISSVGQIILSAMKLNPPSANQE